MPPILSRSLALGLALALAGCATTGPETRVTRFHLDQPIAPGTLAVEPRDPAFASLEFDTFAGAVSSELGRYGFTPGQRGASELIAVVDVQRDFSAGPVKPPPFSIGIGGATFGRSTGFGGGVTLPIGKAKGTEIVTTGLNVQIKRRSDGTVVWEGRAMTQAMTGKPGAAPGDTAVRLASALFRGFPGESGKTISVK